MRRALGLPIATVAALLAVASLPAVALADGAGPRPTIESVSAANVTATDATLEAQINPGSGEDGFSLETTYEFFLEAPWCGSYRLFGGCEASGGVLVYKGTIPGGTTSPQLESVDLANVGHALSPNVTYGYRVVAFNEVGQAFSRELTFTTLPAGKAPVIEAVTVSHLTATDATLEATIDTEDLETEYAFHMWSSPCSKKGSGCELVVPVKLPCKGTLFGSLVPQTVSLDLKSAGVTLGPGEYGFSVTARNAAGGVTASGGVFEAPEEVAGPLKEPVVEPLASPHGSPAGQPAASGQSTGGQTPSSSTSTTTGGSHGGAVADLVPRRAEKAKAHKAKHKKHKPHKAKDKAHTGRRR
jgi:hypothetical protein